MTATSPAQYTAVIELRYLSHTNRSIIVCSWSASCNKNYVFQVLNHAGNKSTSILLILGARTEHNVRITLTQHSSGHITSIFNLCRNDLTQHVVQSFFCRCGDGFVDNSNNNMLPEQCDDMTVLGRNGCSYPGCRIMVRKTLYILGMAHKICEP